MKVMFEKLKWTSFLFCEWFEKKAYNFSIRFDFNFTYKNQMQNLSNRISYESCVIYYEFIG